MSMNVKRRIIDVHAHVLPGIDDGARDMRESMKLLMMAASQGITGVIATPHYSRRKTTHGLDQLAQELQNKIRKFYPDFFVRVGQETYYHDELISRLQAGTAFTLAESRYVLVEFDPSVSYEHLFQGIRRLAAAGYLPILAHVERYACLRQKGVQELVSCECRLQMNYTSLAGSWLSSDVRWCRRQVEDGMIHLLGTDMHRLDYRPPQLEGALKWLENHISPEQMERLTYQNPVHIIKKEKMA